MSYGHTYTVFNLKIQNNVVHVDSLCKYAIVLNTIFFKTRVSVIPRPVIYSCTMDLYYNQLGTRKRYSSLFPTGKTLVNGLDNTTTGVFRLPWSHKCSFLWMTTQMLSFFKHRFLLVDTRPKIILHYIKSLYVNLMESYNTLNYFYL